MTIVSEFVELIRAYDRDTKNNLSVIRKVLEETPFLVMAKEAETNE